MLAHVALSYCSTLTIPQARHRENVQKRLKQVHEDIIAGMRGTYTVFQSDGSEVQQHWHSYTHKMDRMVEEAFRLNVKYSLQELSKAVNGDGKSAPNPLFRVKVILEGDKVRLGTRMPLSFSFCSFIIQVMSRSFWRVTKMSETFSLEIMGQSLESAPWK